MKGEYTEQNRERDVETDVDLLYYTLSQESSKYSKKKEQKKGTQDVVYIMYILYTIYIHTCICISGGM